MTDTLILPRVLPKDWGKDHWSTLLYLETRVVDHSGTIDRRHMRGHREEDKGRYPTRLRDGVELRGHDDFDCLADIVAAGFAESVGPGVYGLTDQGWAEAHRLRRWKADGKGIAKFRYSD